MYDCPVQHALLTHKFTGKERDSESNLALAGPCKAQFNASGVKTPTGRLMNNGGWASQWTSGAEALVFFSAIYVGAKAPTP
jgi:hypothetical protein